MSRWFVLFALFACNPDETAVDTETEEPPNLEVVAGTEWVPAGPRVTGAYDQPGTMTPTAFRTMHGGLNNSDHVWQVISPRMTLDWVAEESFYVPEGPTFDNHGQLYFSPLYPQEDVSLVALDTTSGARQWTVPGDGLNAGSGAILVLDDPDNPGEQLIHHLSYTRAMTLRRDGSEVWSVPTGLTLPPVVQGVRGTSHSYGFNYVHQHDALVGVTMDGKVLAFDRKTGASLASTLSLPGAPAKSNDPGLPQFVVDQSAALTDEVFGQAPFGLSIYETIIDVIFGGGSQVSNYFGVDPNTGRIFVAATADDAEDGTVDGVSEIGALYALELGGDPLAFSVVGSAFFEGGTGATPTISEDGERVYVSDNLGHVIALDRDLDEVWRFDVGSPVAASMAASPDNGELYVVTRSDIVRLTDLGESARQDWVANLNAFDGEEGIELEFNALTPTITANGLAVSIGGGRDVGGREIMLRVGMALLDRATGEIRGFAEGREESIAITSIGPDAAIYTAHSPVRRVSGHALFPDETEPVIGGISRYRPLRQDLIAREALCAAAARAENADTLDPGQHAAAVAEDAAHVAVLLEQARDAALNAGDEMTTSHADEVVSGIDSGPDTAGIRALCESF